jgi:hypothetical protein
LGRADPTFRLNAFALELLPHLAVSQKWSDKLITVLAYEQDFTEEQIDALLDESLPTMGPTLRKSVKDALAIAAYRSQTSYPVVELLLCDDAPQFHWLTAELALCWIHEYRHYKKVVPRFTHHCDLLQDFAESFWKLYHPRDAQRDGAPHKRQKVSVSNDIRVVGRPCAYPTDPCHLA